MTKKEAERKTAEDSKRRDPRAPRTEPQVDVDAWTPKTTLGKKVKIGEITSFEEVIDGADRVLEDEIVGLLLPGLESELLMVGQSKGKFGGGARRIFKQTQKKTPEGNKPSFGTMAVVGNNNGFVGIGHGKSKDTVPAREKALRKAKLNVFKIRRGAGSWEDASTDPHSIPFTVEGRCGSVRIRLMPAPKGKGLVIEKECAKVLRLAGIQNVYSKTFGQTRSKINLIKALEDALRKLGTFKIQPKAAETVAMVSGRRAE